MDPTIYLESSAKPLITVDEFEIVQKQRIASLVGHVFQLTYAAVFGILIQEEKLNRCDGCAIQHSSQRQHSCLMMDSEDAWMFYQDDVVDKIHLAMKTAESVCIAVGFKLDQSWEAYVSELPKFPWTSMYLTSLELEDCEEDLRSRILYAIYHGPNGLKSKDSSVCEVEVQCPETVVRKEEQPMDLDFVINEIQNKIYI